MKHFALALLLFISCTPMREARIYEGKVLDVYTNPSWFPKSKQIKLELVSGEIANLRTDERTKEVILFELAMAQAFGYRVRIFYPAKKMWDMRETVEKVEIVK